MIRVESESNKRDTAYMMIRELAVDQRFRPGEHLHINELSDRLQISVTPVREALIQLHSEGLLAAVPSRGFFSKVPELGELRAIHEFACLVLKHSILKGMSTRPDSARINGASHHGVPSNIDEVFESPFAAHAKFIEAAFERVSTLSANREIIRVVRNFIDRSHYIRMIYLELDAKLDEILDDAADLLDALDAHDTDRAAASIDRHIARKVRRLPMLVREAIVRAYDPPRQVARSTLGQ